MSISGQLDQIHVPDLLGFLSYSNKSGRLILTRTDERAVVLFRNGRVIYATGGGIRETLGNILLRRKLIDEKTLAAALGRQAAAADEVRLGTVLIDMGAITGEQIEDVVREQTEGVLAPLVDWHSGFFRFETIDFETRGEIEVEARDLLSSRGFDTAQLLVAIAQNLEDSRPGVLPELPHSLGEELRRTQQVQLGGEHTAPFLRAVAELVDRGLLFTVRSDQLRVVGQFGDWPARGARGEQNHPLIRPSRLAEALLRGRGVEGAPEAGDLRLLARLGAPGPKECVVAPAWVGGEILVLFYGDNAPTGRPLKGMTRIEAAVLDLGLALEQGAQPTGPATAHAGIDPES
jgi:hypothetical protein